MLNFFKLFKRKEKTKTDTSNVKVFRLESCNSLSDLKNVFGGFSGKCKIYLMNSKGELKPVSAGVGRIGTDPFHIVITEDTTK